MLVNIALQIHNLNHSDSIKISFYTVKLVQFFISELPLFVIWHVIYTKTETNAAKPDEACALLVHELPISCSFFLGSVGYDFLQPLVSSAAKR